MIPNNSALDPLPPALALFFTFLVPLAITGLALINTGLGRSRSAAHTMLAALCVIGTAAAAYFVCGFAWQGYAGLPSHAVTISGKPWSWIGNAPWFFRGLNFDGSPAPLAALLQMLSVGLAALIPLGSGEDRWRLGAACTSTALLAGITYPLFAHWAWGGGWLAQLGINCGLGRGFLDAGGAASIHATGGLTALAIAWILGARRGKYATDGMPAAIPGHNAVLVLLGCLLSLMGWMGLNCAGAILFAGIPTGRLALVAVNTVLAAAAGALTTAAITRVRFLRPDASLCANGWVGGLVAGSAGCAYIAPAAALATGAVAGVLVTYSVEWLDVHLSVDDPGGAVPVHAISGLWGLLACGLFADASTGNGQPGQLLAQITGIAALLGFVLPLTYSLNWLLDRVYRQRVAPEGERQGMDLYELGAGAYPDFILHSDEFTQR